MKPEDQMRTDLQQIHEEALDRYRNKDGVNPMWILERTQFALAHRDAQPAVAVNEQDRIDAERYRWLFGARTEAECKHWNVGLLPHKPQDLIINQAATIYMPKVAVDEEIDAAMAADKMKGGV